MARRKAPLIPDELLDQLLAGRDPQSALGRVASIARGIGDSENPTGPELLLDVKPTFP